MQVARTPQRLLPGQIIEFAIGGDTITVNGDAFDFSSLGEGDELPAGEVPCRYICGPVRRLGGEIHLTLIEAWEPGDVGA